MNKLNQRPQSLWSGPFGAWLPVLAGAVTLILSAVLRGLPISLGPGAFAQLQLTSGILAITFAAAAFVRFRGTRERLPLILAVAFVVVGVALVSSSLGASALSQADLHAGLRDPMTWVIGRTLLAILLVAALTVEKWRAWSRNLTRDVAAATVLAVFVSILLSLAHRYLPSALVVQPGRLFPRPGNLVPAALFLLAALFYQRRLREHAALFDLSIYFAAVINLCCSIAAAQSDRGLDATFVLAAVLQFAGYSVILGGTLLDNIHLFRDIQRLAMTDAVTGLSNYRHLIESLEAEIQRTSRTGRAFALLVFDLDGLKKINDRFGHQVGTGALRRVAEALHSHSRAVDTAARHGGDEFALILPETDEHGAQEALTRICDRVARDPQQPPLSVSAGWAMYPRDGSTAVALLDAADRPLYRMKAQHKHNPSLVKQAAG